MGPVYGSPRELPGSVIKAGRGSIPLASSHSGLAQSVEHMVLTHEAGVQSPHPGLMNPCHYSLLQYRLDPSREEGLNVGIVVTRSPSEVVVRILEQKDLEAVFTRLGLPSSNHIREERSVQAFANRLMKLEDATPKGLVDFSNSEVGPVELLSPHAMRSGDPTEIAESLFQRLVK